MLVKSFISSVVSPCVGVVIIQGHKFHNPQARNYILLHSVNETEIRPRKKKG